MILVPSIDYRIKALVDNEVTDGDTARCLLETDVVEQAVSHHWASRSQFVTRLPEGVALRLIIVGTPERKQPGYLTAGADLQAFFDRYNGRLRVEIYKMDSLSRYLSDVYVEGDRGNTATKWQLDRGWPPHKDVIKHSIARGRA